MLAERRRANDEAELIALRRRILELEDELAAWRSEERDRHRAFVADRRFGFVQTRLKLSPAPARLLIHLMKHAGVAQSRETLFSILISPDSLAAGTRLLSNGVCRIRQALTRAGLDHGVETVWWFGYVLRADSAKAIEAYLEAET